MFRSTPLAVFIFLILPLGSYSQGEIQNTGSPFWKINGNTGTNSANNFLGTIDNISLVFRTNNTSRMTVTNAGLVGIGTLAPGRLLQLGGLSNTLRVDGLATGGTFLSTPSASTDKILFADGLGDIRAIPNGTVNQVISIDAAGVPTWGNGNFWRLNGNALAGTEFLGSTNAQGVRFFCNNIERLRINPTDGEIVAGALASPYAGDLFAGVATAALPFAVNGYSAQNGSGTWGEILAANTTGFSAVQGVYGGSGVGAGCLGNYFGTNTGNTRAGVLGLCTNPLAASAGIGVRGRNDIASGNQRMGVLGDYNGTAFGIGVYGIGFGGGIIAGNNDIAVVGWRNNNQNYSGYFNGNHVVANGTKTASVGTSKGNQLLYVTESPEVWFEDFGSATLENGRCTVHLDPLFLETVVIDEKHPMHVFIQMEEESKPVIVKKGYDSFEVIEQSGGQHCAKFSWRLVAKRVHFQDHRFGNDPVWGAGDTRQYMEYSEPPRIDFDENVKLQMDKRSKGQSAPHPPGFITYEKIQEETSKINTTRP